MKRVIKAATDNVYYWNGVDEVPKDSVNVVIQDGIESINRKAFHDCISLKRVVIPDSITNIGKYAFEGCVNLIDVTIGTGVIDIDVGAFYNCRSLITIVIPDNVINIGELAFSQCKSLTNIIISNRVKTIGPWAFGNCGSLTHVTIPDSVTSIGYCAFYGCRKLADVVLPNKNIRIGEDAFGETLFRPKRVSWKNVQTDLDSDCEIYANPIYEQTEAGSYIDSVCQEVESSIGVYLDTETTSGQGVLFVYSSNDDSCIASGIDYGEFCDEIISLALESTSEAEFKSAYKSYLKSEIESHRCE